MSEGSRDTPIIIACFDQLSTHSDKRSYVWLDHAPMHRSKAFRQRMPPWGRQGVMLKYVPSYASELNLIEIVWRFLKYDW